MLRRVLVTDHDHADTGESDVVLWLGSDSAPDALREACVVVEASSPRAAAVFLTTRPAEVKLALRDPLGFARELSHVRSLPALRAA